MRTAKKHSQFKKTRPGESGLSECTPPHSPGIVSTDPARASYMTYAEQLKSPKWQKKRLEVLESNNFTCQMCHDTDSELHVHHLIYRDNHMIWDYPNDELAVLCKDCHKDWHETMKLFSLEVGKTLLNYNGIWFDDLIGVLLYCQNNDVSSFRKLICKFKTYSE
jgi:5-methylcytosine-specific restriction endonuclease McrA